MWKIYKDFDFCYAHRVYVQQLNTVFCSAGDIKCACRHIHGHQGKLRVYVESENLDSRGMVIDFKELGFMKDFVDNYLDHKFIIDSADPMFKHLVDGTWALLEHSTFTAFKEVRMNGMIAGYTIDLDLIKDSINKPEYEVLEGFFIVNFIPTSENISKWLHTIAQAKLNEYGNGFVVSKVEFFETPKSCSSYEV